MKLDFLDPFHTGFGLVQGSETALVTLTDVLRSALDGAELILHHLSRSFETINGGIFLEPSGWVVSFYIGPSSSSERRL